MMSPNLVEVAFADVCVLFWTPACSPPVIYLPGALPSVYLTTLVGPLPGYRLPFLLLVIQIYCWVCVCLCQSRRQRKKH
jgi:hypothetical protein